MGLREVEAGFPGWRAKRGPTGGSRAPPAGTSGRGDVCAAGQAIPVPARSGCGPGIRDLMAPSGTCLLHETVDYDDRIH